MNGTLPWCPAPVQWYVGWFCVAHCRDEQVFHFKKRTCTPYEFKMHLRFIYREVQQICKYSKPLNVSDHEYCLYDWRNSIAKSQWNELIIINMSPYLQWGMTFSLVKVAISYFGSTWVLFIFMFLLFFIITQSQTCQTSFSICPIDGSIATHLRDSHFSGKKNVLFPVFFSISSVVYSLGKLFD